MRQAFAFVGELLAALGPAIPGQWTGLAKHLARGPGWAPSMMLCATFGGAMFFSALVNWLVQGLVADVINVATYASWVVVCCFAMLIAIRRSMRNAFRMGAFALTRARWWFECAMTSWNVAVLLFLVTLAVSWSATLLQAPLVETLVWQAGRVLTSTGLATFAIAGTVGYGISLVRRRWPTGRASQCVHFFLLMPLGCGGLMAAAEHWPIRGWLDGLILIGGSTLAVLAIGIVIVAGGRAFETSWRRNEANHSYGRGD